MTHNFIQRSLADEELLRYITHTVEGGAEQGEEVAFELVAAGDAPEARALGDVVGAKEDANAADADEDADDLEGVVADVEEE